MSSVCLNAGSLYSKCGKKSLGLTDALYLQNIQVKCVSFSSCHDPSFRKHPRIFCIFLIFWRLLKASENVWSCSYNLWALPKLFQRKLTKGPGTHKGYNTGSFREPSNCRYVFTIIVNTCKKKKHNLWIYLYLS